MITQVAVWRTCVLGSAILILLTSEQAFVVENRKEKNLASGAMKRSWRLRENCVDGLCICTCISFFKGWVQVLYKFGRTRISLLRAYLFHCLKTFISPRYNMPQTMEWVVFQKVHVADCDIYSNMQLKTICMYMNWQLAIPLTCNLFVLYSVNN